MNTDKKHLNIAICLHDFLVEAGLRYLLSTFSNTTVSQFSNIDELNTSDEVFDVIVIDPIAFSPKQLTEGHLESHLLAISSEQNKTAYVEALDAGIISYVLNCCDEEELTQAIWATSQGDRFFCAKVVKEITLNNKLDFRSTCEGLNISEREIEIIRLIAEGYTNKQIAEILFISGHTVTTHRKNIMNKLGVNNTAGIVLFAVKEKIVVPNKFLFSSNQAS